MNGFTISGELLHIYSYNSNMCKLHINTKDDVNICVLVDKDKLDSIYEDDMVYIKGHYENTHRNTDLVLMTDKINILKDKKKDND